MRKLTLFTVTTHTGLLKRSTQLSFVKGWSAWWGLNFSFQTLSLFLPRQWKDIYEDKPNFSSCIRDLAYRSLTPGLSQPYVQYRFTLDLRANPSIILKNYYSCYSWNQMNNPLHKDINKAFRVRTSVIQGLLWSDLLSSFDFFYYLDFWVSFDRIVGGYGLGPRAELLLTLWTWHFAQFGRHAEIWVNLFLGVKTRLAL